MIIIKSFYLNMSKIEIEDGIVFRSV